ncbi:MAG: flagellar basal body P-ring formation chaperone FlgA [Rickettsiaceae bacterium]|nr:flagellar basal body P-ring formation chaperone FlgA [Rickettsiaceae bacterium]
MLTFRTKKYIIVAIKQMAFIALVFFTSYSRAGYFERTVRELILEKLGENTSLNIKFESNAKLTKIIEQENDIKSLTLSFFSPETKSFKVVSLMQNNQTIELFGKFERFYQIVIAKRSIKYGKEIGPEDCSMLKVKKIKSEDEMIVNPSSIYGMEAKTNISIGQVIKLSDLKNPTVIKENDPVTLVYSAPGIELKTLGIALSSGAINDKIRVKNEKTGIIVFGEIINKNNVRVSTSDEK